MYGETTVFGWIHFYTPKCQAKSAIFRYIVVLYMRNSGKVEFGIFITENMCKYPEKILNIAKKQHKKATKKCKNKSH